MIGRGGVSMSAATGFHGRSPVSEQSGEDVATPSRRSLIGLNAANFFLAEIVGVVMPFLGKYLKQHEWSETEIGVALSVGGLGVFVMQTPSGFIVDRVRHR